jgi:hypothetical protein
VAGINLKSMANLITYEYFDQYNMINLPVPSADDRTGFITHFEKEYLIRVFGYTLYKLIAAYNANTSPQRIKDIVTGKEFEESPFTYKWNGLINAEKESPIAYYVYFKYMKAHETHTTTQGEKKNKGANSDNVINDHKLINAWNEMCQLTGNQNDYRVDSIYYFMTKNIETYPEWQFEGFEKINSFGI